MWQSNENEMNDMYNDMTDMSHEDCNYNIWWIIKV